MRQKDIRKVHVLMCRVAYRSIFVQTYVRKPIKVQSDSIYLRMFLYFRLLRPTDYLAAEVVQNPQVLSTVLQMLDTNNDGMISPVEIEEVFRH